MRTIIVFILLQALLVFLRAEDVCEATTKCGSITCGVPRPESFSNSNIGCNCTQADIGTRFTTCSTGENPTKSLFWYYKPPATCISTTSLHEPVTEIACNVMCTAGQKFDVDTKSCVKCEDGSYASGSVINVNKWTKREGLLPDMKSYCYGSIGSCKPWFISEEGYLESGDNKNAHSLYSIIEYPFEIVQDYGTITFEYEVHAEDRYDKFEFSMDSPPGGLIISISQQNWTTFSMNVTKGYHRAKFAYFKDFSFTRDLDVARIRKLQITGLSEVAIRCEKCIPGYFSKNANECQPCPAGTYSDSYGASECSLCPAGQSSFEGSSSCFTTSIPCTESDYTYYTTQCVAGTSTKVYEWIEPLICNTTHNESVPLPESEQVTCQVPASCNPGQAPDATTYDCAYCPAGTVSSGSKCEKCGSGSAAEVKKITIEKFKTRDSVLKQMFISTECTGECSSKGWRFTDQFADSGLGNGVSESRMRIDLTQINAKKLSVDYVLTCNVGTGSLDFEIDGSVVKSIECSGCTQTEEFSNAEVDIYEGARQAIVSYKTISLLSQDAYHCDRTIVKKISIDHQGTTAIGGAFKCVDCLAGEYTNNGTVCETCGAGYKSGDKSTKCEICPENTFSYSHSSTCYNCGNGMVSSEGSEYCTWEYGKCHFNSTIASIEREFDFGAVGEALSTVAAVYASEPENAFYFNMCGERISRSLKQVAEDNPCLQSGSYICKLTKAGDVISLGKSVDIKTGLYGSDLADDTGVHFVYTDLSESNCFDNKTNTHKNYNSIVNLRCDTSSQSDAFIGPSITMPDMCTYRVDFLSRYGCPACTEDDYTALEGECDPKTLQKEVVYVRKTDKANICAGGVQPETKKVKCQINVITAPYWIVAAVLVVAVLIIVALGGAAIFFYYKFRDASQKFHQLSEGDENVNTGRATEMN